MRYLHRLIAVWPCALVASLLVSSFIPSVALAQLPVVQLSSLSQACGQVGTEFDVRIVSGGQLDEIDQLLFTVPNGPGGSAQAAPGIVATLHTDDPLPFTEDRVPRYGHFRVAISANAPAGCYEVRARGRYGLSNPRRFVVTSLKTIALDAVSHDAKSPTRLERDVLYHTKAAAENTSYFAFHADAGETIHVDVIAQRLDSRMIAKLMLRDPSGRWIRALRGADQADPRLSFKAEMSGDYVIGVNDYLFAGGDDHFYQVVIQQGDAIKPIVAPEQNPRSASSVTVHASAAESVIAVAETADDQKLSLPCIVSAAFDHATDVDAYRFDAQQDETYAIEVESQRMGEPTDVRLSLERLEAKPDGTETWHSVRVEDDSQDVGDAAIHLYSRDPSFLFPVPMAGTYRVTLRDLDTGSALSDRQTYRLHIRRPAPSFKLVAYFPSPTRDSTQSGPQGIQLVRHGTQAVAVTAVRLDGWSGPIRVGVEGLPEGVSCRECVIAANQSQANLTLAAAGNAASWLGPIRVVGKASSVAGDAASPEISTEATAVAITWGRGAGRNRVQSRLSDSLFLSVSNNDELPLSYAALPSDPARVKKDSAVVVPVTIERREGGKQPIVLRAQVLPPGVTMAEVTIPADQTEAKLEFKTNAAVVPGVYSLSVQGETKVTVPFNPQALPRAEAYRAHLAALLADASKANEHAAIMAAVPAAGQRVEAARAQAKPQDRTVLLASPAMTLEIEAP